jgi:alanine racemase
MIKANAYGHGAVHLLPVLEAHPKVMGYGVATLSEAIELRFEGRATKEIVVFSDTGAWNEERAQAFRQHRLIPVFSTLESLKAYEQVGVQIPFEIEITTGMNRAGIGIDELQEVRSSPAGIFTHLAESDDPGSSLSRHQLRGIHELLGLRKERFPQSRIHWANSGAIFDGKFWEINRADLVRPGLSLYGLPPDPSARYKKLRLRPVMNFEAQVLQSRWLKTGERVGYSGTYKVRPKRGEWILTLGAGYADGVPRLLSNIGQVLCGRTRRPIAGRVSMDVMNVCSPRPVAAGSWVEVWGNGISAWDVASLVKSTPYELLTGVSNRVQRIYE